MYSGRIVTHATWQNVLGKRICSKRVATNKTLEKLTHKYLCCIYYVFAKLKTK